MDDYKTILEDAMKLLREWDRQRMEEEGTRVCNPDVVDLAHRIKILEGVEK